MATVAPSFTSISAMARPSPDDAPCTRARFPLSLRSICVLLEIRRELGPDERSRPVEVHLIRPVDVPRELRDNLPCNLPDPVGEAVRRKAEADQRVAGQEFPRESIE